MDRHNMIYRITLIVAVVVVHVTLVSRHALAFMARCQQTVRSLQCLLAALPLPWVESLPTLR
jgi:hypothetical protein